MQEASTRLSSIFAEDGDGNGESDDEDAAPEEEAAEEEAADRGRETSCSSEQQTEHLASSWHSAIGSQRTKAAAAAAGTEEELRAQVAALQMALSTQQAVCGLGIPTREPSQSLHPGKYAGAR